MAKIGFMLAIVAAVVVVSLLHSSEAVRCYCTVCSTAAINGTDTGCAYCQTVTTGALGYTASATKSCVATCTSSGVSIPGVSVGSVSCCQTDLCNGATSNVQMSLIAALATAAFALLFSRQ